MSIFGTKKDGSLDLLSEEEHGQTPGSLILPLLICGIIIGGTLLAYVALLVLNINTQSQANKVRKDTELLKSEWQKYEPIASEIKSITSKKILFDQNSLKYQSFSKKLEKIGSLVPEGSSLTNLVIALNGKATLTGTTTDPEVAYQFQEDLLKDKELSEVNLISLTKKGEVYIFEFSLQVLSK